MTTYVEGTRMGTVIYQNFDRCATVRLEGGRREVAIHPSGMRCFVVQGDKIVLDVSARPQHHAELPAIGQTIYTLASSIGTKQVIWSTTASFNEANQVLTVMPMYRLKLKSGKVWEGKDLSAPDLHKMYNPVKGHKLYKRGAEWEVSHDNGASFVALGECPHQFTRQYERGTGRRIAA